MKIRDAAITDASALYRLNCVSMGYDHPEEKTAAQLEKLLDSGRDKLLVAEIDGQVVGYLHLVDYELLYAGPLKNVMGIAVDPEHRRMGIGKALLEAGEKWARESGAEGIRLVSGESRVGAHAFYRALGYEGSKMQLNLKKMF
ncbi:GNAT family N-acetyltransferase [Acutalibacter muris]|uniref:GNAT family N-acetyltransferase n=1 Tax=Acutalibacter muris TaxID=1796620 RepID=UPI00272AA888|nr:GNAT family N-acetyltransferase [Acutalibacter muris]MCI9192306.1 GNAT family N-acetyltransferase [Acutalibacter muris]